MPSFLAFRQFHNAHPFAEQTAVRDAACRVISAAMPHVVRFERRIFDEIDWRFQESHIRLLVDLGCVFRLQITEDEAVLRRLSIGYLILAVYCKIDGNRQ